jgi:hypothetical protein
VRTKIEEKKCAGGRTAWRFPGEPHGATLTRACQIGEQMQRKEQTMTVSEVYDRYAEDIDSNGFSLYTWKIIFGALPQAKVRFTTDSHDHFDTESLREMQPVKG